MLTIIIIMIIIIIMMIIIIMITTAPMARTPVDSARRSAEELPGCQSA